MTSLTPAALDLILSFETGGQAGYQPSPEWPGGQSGLTIGIGYDLGYQTDDGFRADWGSRLAADDFSLLAPLVGKKAPSAESEITAAVANLKGKVSIPWDAAVAVFDQITAPRFINETLEAYPGSDQLPGDSLGALVSLVFNRGSGFGTEGQATWDSRRELRQMRDAIAAGDSAWPSVIELFASQVRLWNEGQPSQWNLAGRRLVEGSLFATGLRGAALLPPQVLINGDGGRDDPNRSPRVKSLQKALNGWGADIGADGDFGRKTLLALWSWQKATEGLNSTGVADVDSLTRLNLL